MDRRWTEIAGMEPNSLHMAAVEIESSATYLTKRNGGNPHKLKSDKMIALIKRGIILTEAELEEVATLLSQMDDIVTSTYIEGVKTGYNSRIMIAKSIGQEAQKLK